LHWFDIQYFKTYSFINYDFGGWYSGSTDIKKLRINKFKEEFGGEIKEFFNYTQYCSHFSKLLSIYRQIKSKYQNRLL